MTDNVPGPPRAGTILLLSPCHSSTRGSSRMWICSRKRQQKGLKACTLPVIPSGHPCVPRPSFLVPGPAASAKASVAMTSFPAGWHHRADTGPSPRRRVWGAQDAALVGLQQPGRCPQSVPPLWDVQGALGTAPIPVEHSQDTPQDVPRRGWQPPVFRLGSGLSTSSAPAWPWLLLPGHLLQSPIQHPWLQQPIHQGAALG